MCGLAIGITLTMAALVPETAQGQQVVDLRRLNLPRWTLQEELRLGSVDGEQDAFVRPQLKVDSEGRLYVTDGGIPAVRVFDQHGNFIRQIGRKGMGPGEYTMPINVGFIGDTTWVIDAVTRRVSFFGRGGRHLGDATLESDPSDVQPDLFVEVFGPDDFIVLSPPGPDRFLRGHSIGRVNFRQSIVRRNRSGTRRDTLASYTVEPGIIITQDDAAGHSQVPYRGIPQLPIISYIPEYNEITHLERTPANNLDVGEFRVTIRRPDGTVIADRRFRYKPVPLPRSVKDSIRAEMESRYRGARVSLGAEKQLAVALQHLGIPDYVPPASGVVRGSDGTWWLARQSSTDPSPEHYLVTDAALNPIATVVAPPNVSYLTGQRTRDHVWAVVKGEFDIQYLVRYRIRRN